MNSVRYAIHPEDFKKYDTNAIRQAVLINNIFQDNQLTHTYTHYDRLIVGGIKPVSTPVTLLPFDELKAEYFLQRREIGIINFGAAATIMVDQQEYLLGNKDALYIGKGVRDVVFLPGKNGTPLLYYK